jgi:hypothetical protein
MHYPSQEMLSTTWRTSLYSWETNLSDSLQVADSIKTGSL